MGSGGYARSRPTYPDSLFADIAGIAPGHGAAWDCATGSGQAARGLARHFARVEATDASAEQVANALAVPNVRYTVQPAEATDFADASFDLVTVAQALHWFDVDRFYAEVHRVLKPGGVLAVLGYAWSRFTPQFDPVFERVVIEPLRPFWPPQNKLLWDHYRDLPFPFEPVALPAPDIELVWTLDQVLDYVGTWTAAKKRLESQPRFLVDARAELAGPWGAEPARLVRFPMLVKCGRVA